MANKKNLEAALLKTKKGAKLVLNERRKAELRRTLRSMEICLHELLNVNKDGKFVAGLEKIIAKLDDVKTGLEKKDNKDVVQGIVALNKTIVAYLQKEIVVKVDAPDVHVAAPIVNVPEQKTTVIDKTTVVQETKIAERAAKSIDKILERLQKVNFGVTKISNTSPADAIPVVLVDRTLKGFYDAISSAIAGISQNAAQMLTDSHGNKVGVTNNALDVNITGGNVTLNAEDVEIGAIEIKNGADDTRAKVGDDGLGNNSLYVKDANADTSLTNIDTNIGAKADASATSDTGTFSLIALIKRLLAKLTAGIGVTGTFWQATQPVSAASLPLPTGAATDTKQDTGNTSLSSIDGKLSTKAIKSLTGQASSSGNNTCIPLVVGKRIKVIAFSLIANNTTAVTAKFQDGAGGTDLWRVPLQTISGTYAGANLATSAPSLLFATSAGVALNINLSAAQTVDWSVTYFDDDAS